jgi:hypothetical protein
MRTDQLIGEQRALGGQLGAGVAGADHDERAPGRPLERVVGQLGELDLPGDVIAQVERLRDASEAVCDLGDPGYRQQLVDAADSDHQAVVAEFPGLPLGRPQRQPPGLQVDATHLAEHARHPAKRGCQRHRHPAGIQDAGGHLWQQWQVEEVVRRVHQGDVRGATRRPGEFPGGVVAGEATTDDHDPCVVHRRLILPATCAGAGPGGPGARRWQLPALVVIVRRQPPLDAFGSAPASLTCGSPADLPEPTQ